MAQNNVTEVVNGIVQPRFYQVYGDLIESKEIMEPLAITAGTGPICGFDWVDTTQQDVTITSVFKKPSTLPSGVANILGRARRVFLSNKDNTAGQVFNAYTTPDGLCHIAPDVLTFNGVQPSGGWPSLSNPQKLVAFAVKATHTYRPDGSENPPSVTNFTCGWLTFDKVYGLDEVLSWDYERMLELLADSGMPFNKNVDSFIGVYLVGWRPEWDSDPSNQRYKSIMSSLNYTLCLVPIHGQFPVKPYGMNPLDILDLKARVKVLEESTVPGVMSYVNNLISSLGQGIEVVVSKDPASSDDNEGFIFTKLNINGSNFVAAGPVTKTLDYQWYESSDAMGIFVSPEIDIDSKTQQVPTDKWDIGTVSFKPNSEGAMEYSFVSPPSGKETWKLVGCILPQFSAYSNESICVPTGFYQLMNPDAAIGWRVAMNLKRLHSRLGGIEVADSGNLPFHTASSTDHHAHIKAFMGTSTLTLRVVVYLYNKGTSNADLSYDLSKLFSNNSKMSSMLSEILRLGNRSEINRVMMAMPSTFKARDIRPELFSSEDCEFSKYTSWLEITNSVAEVKVLVGTVTKASGPEAWVEVAHMITIPISDRTGEVYAGIQAEGYVPIL